MAHLAALSGALNRVTQLWVAGWRSGLCFEGDAKQIDRFAGGKVKVAGDVSGTTITLYSIDH
jgi:hypothetical protein